MAESKKTVLNARDGFGIVLSGGGAAGSYEAGVIKALKEAGIKFKVAAGTSVGALNASLIAADKVDRMLQLWEKIDQKQVINFRPTSWRRGFLFNDSPLEQLMRKEIDKDAAKKIIDAEIKLIVISLSLKTQKEVVNTKFRDHEHIIKSLMASCSIPVAFPLQEFPVEGDGSVPDSMVDGGVVNNFPIKQSIETGLCKNFFTVSLNIPGVEYPDDKKKDKSLMGIGIRTFRIAMANSYTKEINAVREKIDLANALKEICDIAPPAPQVVVVSAPVDPSAPASTAVPVPVQLPPQPPSEKDVKINKLYEQFKEYEGINIIEINPSKPLPMGILDFSADKAKKAMEMGYADAKDKLKELEIIS